MNNLDATIAVPLTVTEYGTIRISNSRVSLDSVVHHYKLGATAEEIAYKFPALNLADIHLAIAYYLTHREAVEEYLCGQEAEGEALKNKIESDPAKQERMAGLRERILARWEARQEAAGKQSSR